MKRIVLILISIFVFISYAQAQLTATGNYKIYNNYRGIDYIVVFEDMDNATEIMFSGTNINWYKFSNPSNSISNLSSLSPEDNTGYIIKADGVEKTCWVFNYKNYIPQSIILNPENASATQCKELKINLVTEIPPMKYFTKENIGYTIERNFNLTYQTLEWSESTWKSKEVLVNFNLIKNEIIVEDVPLNDTYFTITGDQFATDLNINPISFTSSLYSAVAVACKITSVTTERNEKNEAERPDKTSITGSAPLDILFKSNANVPVALFYNWSLYKNNDILINRNDQEFRYTFSDAGSYKVLLTVNNNYCSNSDSITINVSTSAIQVPNVFTPNGDGVNDEFRVAYKSLKSFQCWIYSRWGRKVYYWNDPQKGWDGKINGRDADEGAYFYVIRAYGTDFDKNSKPDQLTKRRVGEYTLKGDINLLRGKKN